MTTIHDSLYYRVPGPKRVGRYSKRVGLARLNLRSAEGQLVRDMRANLAKDFPDPSPFHRELIERLCMLKLQLSAFDQRSINNGGQMSKGDADVYLAWHNSFARTLSRLYGMPEPNKGPAGGWSPQFSADTEAA